MACVNPNGEITDSARKILAAMENPVPLSRVAAETGYPLFRIRSASRELADAGLAAASGEAWQVTPAGRTAMAKLLLHA